MRPKIKAGDVVRLRSGGQAMTVISEAEWHTACDEEPRDGFVPCIFWRDDEDYYKDFPASALLVEQVS